MIPSLTKVLSPSLQFCSTECVTLVRSRYVSWEWFGAALRSPLQFVVDSIGFVLRRMNHHWREHHPAIVRVRSRLSPWTLRHFYFTSIWKPIFQTGRPIQRHPRSDNAPDTLCAF